MAFKLNGMGFGQGTGGMTPTDPNPPIVQGGAFSKTDIPEKKQSPVAPTAQLVDAEAEVSRALENWKSIHHKAEDFKINQLESDPNNKDLQKKYKELSSKANSLRTIYENMQQRYDTPVNVIKK